MYTNDGNICQHLVTKICPLQLYFIHVGIPLRVTFYTKLRNFIQSVLYFSNFRIYVGSKWHVLKSGFDLCSYVTSLLLDFMLFFGIVCIDLSASDCGHLYISSALGLCSVSSSSSSSSSSSEPKSIPLFSYVMGVVSDMASIPAR